MTVIGFIALVVLLVLFALFEKGPPTELKDVHSGLDYEQYCAAKLEEHGWKARVTQASGDQGVDIVAKYPLGGFKSLSAAIQCKYYANAVGNKAVQEVIAGRIYSKTDFAVVICSSWFTESAAELAQAANVVLISHDDIPKLSKRLQGLAFPNWLR